MNRVTPAESAKDPARVHYTGMSSALRPDLLVALDAPWLKVAYAAIAIGVFLSGYHVLRASSINLTLSDIALIAAAIIFAARGQLATHPFGSLTGFWLLGFTLMVGGLFLSSVVNGNPARGLIVAAQYSAALLLVPFVLASADLRFTKRLPVLFVVGVSISQLIGLIALALFTHADTRDLLGPGFITGNGRIGAMAGEPNPNGALVAFALPMLVYSWQQGLMRKELVLLFAILLTWGLVQSASFTGFVAAAVGVSVALALTGFRYLLVAVSVVLVVVSLFIASDAALPEVFRERVLGAIATGDFSQAGTFTARSDLIAEAWELSQGKLLLGLGADQYRQVSVYGAPVHNLQLLVWTEGGFTAICGLVILLCLLLLLACVGLRNHRAESAMAVAVVVVFLIYTSSIPHMYSRFWTVPVMVALSTIYALRGRPPSKPGEVNAVATV